MNSKKFLSALFVTGIIIATTGTHAYAQKALTKEVTQEVAAQKGALIRIVASSRKVSIKSWDQPKVKITMELTYDSAAPKRTDAEWFDVLGVNVKPFSNRVDISTRAEVTVVGYRSQPFKVTEGKKHQSLFEQRRKSATTQEGNQKLEEVIVQGYRTPSKGTQKLDEVIVQGFPSPSKGTIILKPTVRVMNIMVPAGCKLDVENKYGDVVIAMNVDEAKLQVTNGALDAQDIKDLQLTGNYCTANLGNIEKAEIEFNNGTFRALDIKELDMDSKSSTVEYEKGSYLYLRSQNDNYAIEAIDKVDGRKLYGSIKIDQLNNSFDLEGNNVDIKFRNIAPTVSLIKINNRYGDVRIPVKSLKNYYVDFIGNYSTVFAPFQKEVVKEEKKEGEANVEQVVVKAITDDNGVVHKLSSTRGSLGEVAPRHFTSTVGDTKGQHTRIELTCHSCTVDFK